MSPDRNVLRLITRLNIGGPSKQALLLTKELRDRWPTLLGAGRVQEAEGELSDPEVDIARLPLVRPPHPAMDAKAVVAVRSLIGSYRPAIVHTHMAKAGAVGRTVASRVTPRPRTVHTFHGHVLEGYFPPWLQKTAISMERRLARRTDVLVAVSDEIKLQLLDLGVGTASQYEVIPLGFDLSSFLCVAGRSGRLRPRFGIGEEVPLIGVLGRLAPIKDHATLFEAVALIDGVHLAILGDGELRDDLVQRASTLGIADRVHFAGWRLDVAECIADLDIVALTSRNEGSPVSLIEALACARPVVATDVGGVRSVVVEGKTGFLCAAGDVAGIRGRLQTLITDPELRQRMGAEGRKSVSARYDQGRLIEDIASLYEGLVGPS